MSRLLTTLVLTLSLIIAACVSSTTLSAKKRAITRHTALSKILKSNSKTIEEKLAAIEEVTFKKASEVRGLADVWEDIRALQEKHPSHLYRQIEMALLGRLSKLDDPEILKDLREDVLDGDVDSTLRDAYFQSIITDTSADVSDMCVTLADDQYVIMRINAISELGSRRYEKGFNVCMARLNDGARRVQVTALDAVAEYARINKETHDAVVTELITDFMQNQRNKGEKLQRCRVVLEELTREKNIGPDPLAWLEWWRGQKDENKKKEVDERKDGYKTKVRKVWDIDTSSTKLIFVIDSSSSMAEPIEVKSVPRSGESEEEKRRNNGIEWDKVKTKLDLARAELKQYINMMEPDEYFTIVSYNTTVQTWNDEIVPATPENLKDAHKFLDKLATGKLTNIYGALNRAFEIAENAAAAAEAAMQKRLNKRGSKREKSSTDDKDADEEPLVPDTIIFLTDGYATTGEYQGPKITGKGTADEAKIYAETMKKMLKEIALRNSKLLMTIHAVAIGEQPDKTTLKALAKENRGDYRQLRRGGNAPDAKGDEKK